MAHRIACDDQPSAVALLMIPKLLVDPGRVIPQIQIVVHFGRRDRHPIGSINKVSIAEICELGGISRAKQRVRYFHSNLTRMNHLTRLRCGRVVKTPHGCMSAFSNSIFRKVRQMNFISRIASVCGALLFIATPVLSLSLAPGGVIFPSGTTFAADPEQGGVVQNDNLLNFRMDPTPGTPLTDVGGAVQNRVVESDVTNQLIFSPRIRNTFNIDGGRFGIVGFRLDGYAGWDTDVDFRLDGSGDKGFGSVSRSVSGDLLNFRYITPLFIDAIAPGLQEESLFPAIKTNATSFAATGTMQIFGQLFSTQNSGPPVPTGDLISVRIDGVMAPVPVPATGLLVLSAIGGLVALRRRTHKVA